MAHEIFISYSERDKPIALGICANLEAAGIRCWIAPRDITPGDDWPSVISNAISQSRIMVLVFSSQSNASEDVARELMLAAQNRLVIIPFKIENIEPGPGMKYYLARTHWLDAMNPPTQEQINLLVETVKRLLGSKEAVQESVGHLPVREGEKETPKQKVPLWAWGGIASGLIFLCSAVCIGGLLAGSQFLNPGLAVPTKGAETPPALDKTRPPLADTEPNFAFPSSEGPSTQEFQPSETAAATATLPALPAGSGVSLLPTPIPLSSRAISVENAARVKKISMLDVSESGSLVWSRDGKWLVIGGRKIHIYDAHSLQEVRSLEYEVGGLAISPNSKILAAASWEGIILFDMASGIELRTLPQTHISSSALSNSYLAFAPDSSTLAVIINDVVKLFRVDSGEETGVIVAKGSYHIFISPDGKYLYSCGTGDQVAVWDMATGTQIRGIGNSSISIDNMILSPDGSLVATASYDGSITLWDALTGQQLRILTGHTETATSLVFSPDGKVLASASGDVTIRLWDAAAGTLLTTLVGHSEPATNIDFSADGSTLASSTYVDGVFLWGLP
jgi:WD40 repeat protein